ncbi:MAG: hypothetical protein N3A38_12685, partial [Planctomycetota bacterium]|nr:hypothetical protein [Planctomycetota bacterium]
MCIRDRYNPSDRAYRIGDFVRGAPEDVAARIALDRTPLHAAKISFDHPADGRRITVEAPLPRDIKEFLRLLRKYRSKGGVRKEEGGGRGRSGGKEGGRGKGAAGGEGGKSLTVNLRTDRAGRCGNS